MRLPGLRSLTPGLGNAVSCGTCLLGEAAELDEQSLPVPGGEFGQVTNERGDLLAVGLAEVLGAAELGGVLLHQRGIQTMLANQKAELVAEFGFAITVGGLGRKLPYIRLGLTGAGRDPISSTEQRPIP